MARKSIPSKNPIRTIRLSRRESLQEFADKCKVHLQAVYLNEMGMYPTVLPSIMKRLQHMGVAIQGVEEQYRDFVEEQRYEFGSLHSPYTLPEPSLSINPLHNFRASLNYHTAFGFAKAICLNPTIVRRVESCAVEDFPGQLVLSLRDIQLPVGDIEELQYQHREYYYSGLRFRKVQSSSREDSASYREKTVYRREPRAESNG